MPTYAEALKAVRTLLEFIGDDPMRPGLLDTPNRIFDAWGEDWGKGYHDFAYENLIEEIKCFDNQDPIYDQMLIEKDLVFYSHCEHHMTPFFGEAAIAYIPHDGKIVGISKLARIVDHFASRLQVQERLTGQIAEFIVKHISPDCAVTMEAIHLCMASRGIRQPKSKTITTALRGIFKSDPSAQAEFISRVR